MAELVDAALHGGTESYMSAAFKIRTGSNPVLTANTDKLFNINCKGDLILGPPHIVMTKI